MTSLLGKWLQALKRKAAPGARARRGAQRARPHRVVPRLETLEDRTVPSTLTVTSAADSGAGSLRAEIAAANSGDTIQFAQSLAGQTITLKSELAITRSLTIEGLGAKQLTISGNHQSRVFDISGSTTNVAISDLTIANGLANTATTTGPGGAVALGGGILNTGAQVTLSHVGMADNRAIGPQSGYVQTNLVSDIPGLAQLTDPNLKDPWGIALSPQGPFTIADGTAKVSTSYAVTEASVTQVSPTIRFPTVATGPLGPTGMVRNDTSSFLVNGTPASFIYAAHNPPPPSRGVSVIAAWNPSLGTTAQVEATIPGAVYTGLDLESTPAGDFLYAANAFQNRIDVFDGSFNKVTLPAGAFVDPELPMPLVPFNIEGINGNLYVAYAPRTRPAASSAPEGAGAVGVFDTSGHFIRQLTAGGKLAAPWGIVLAPPGFGQFSGDLLVGNFSFKATEINAFDPASGAYLGTLTDSSGHTLLSNAQGLWDLTFGNGGRGGLANTLYIATGLDDENHGLFAAITPAPGLAEGGAVANVSGGTLTLSHDVIADNQALGTFGKAEGGGVFNQASTLTADHSTFRDNVVMGGTRLVGTEVGSTTGAGGAIASDLAGAALSVSHSAFEDNQAIGGAGASGVRGSNGAGGGLWNGDGSTLTVSHSTFSRNQAIGGAGGAGQAGGLGNGGGLNNRDTTQASVDDSRFTDNLAIGGAGGAGGTGGAGQGGGVADGSVSAAAALTISHSTFRGNRAMGGDGAAGGDGVGGGVANVVAVAGVGSATLTVSHTTFTDNQALGGAGSGTGTGGVGRGGGIANVGNVSIATLTVRHSTLRDNQARGGIGGSSGNGEGGGIANENGARLTVTGSTLSDNRAIGGRRSKEGIPPEHNGAGNGGGIQNNGTGTVATVSHTILRGNRAIGGDGVAGAAGGLGRGGAITTGFGSTLAVTDSRLSDNQALGGAGGAGGPGGNGGNGGSAVGGAILNASGALTVADSTFAGNQALGGAGGAGGPGGHGGAGGLALGGGIASAEPPIPPRVLPTLDVSGSTFRGNEAVGGAGAAGGAGGDGQGGALAISAGTAAITDTKITGNEAEGGDGGAGADGGNGQGGGVWVGGGVTLTVSASRITHNEAEGGPGGEGGSDGQGAGGGVYNLGTFFLDAATVIRHNHASTSDDDVFGDLGD